MNFALETILKVLEDTKPVISKKLKRGHDSRTFEFIPVNLYLYMNSDPEKVLTTTFGVHFRRHTQKVLGIF